MCANEYYYDIIKMALFVWQSITKPSNRKAQTFTLTCECRTFARAHTKQCFDRTESSLTQTLSGRESGKVDWAVSVFRIYES